MEAGNDILIGLLRGAMHGGVYSALVSSVSVEVVATNLREYTSAEVEDGL